MATLQIECAYQYLFGLLSEAVLEPQRLGHQLDPVLRRELHAVDLAVVLAHGQLELCGARTERLQPDHVLVDPSVGHLERRRVVRGHAKRADREDALVPGTHGER